MQFEFDEKIDHSIQKSLKATVGVFKDRIKLAEETGSPQSPPSYEEFESVLTGIMERNKQAEFKKLRTPSFRDLFERAWAQKLRNFATQEQLRDSYEALVRRY